MAVRGQEWSEIDGMGREPRQNGPSTARAKHGMVP
jgi:hypothetical protein